MPDPGGRSTSSLGVAAAQQHARPIGTHNRRRPPSSVPTATFPFGARVMARDLRFLRRRSELRTPRSSGGSGNRKMRAATPKAPKPAMLPSMKTGEMPRISGFSPGRPRRSRTLRRPPVRAAPQAHARRPTARFLDGSSARSGLIRPLRCLRLSIKIYKVSLCQYLYHQLGLHRFPEVFNNVHPTHEPPHAIGQSAIKADLRQKARP